MSKPPVSVAHDAEDEDMPTGLIRRDGRYSLRRRIPKNALPYYAGKTHLVRTLETPDRAEACRRHPHMWLKMQREFDEAARIVAQRAQDNTPPVGPSEAFLSWSPERRKKYTDDADRWVEANAEFWAKKDLEDEASRQAPG